MVYISYILVWSNIQYHIPCPLRGSSPIFFSKLGACTLLFSISGLDIQKLAFTLAHGLLTVAHGLLTVAHVCSRFAHGFRGSFWVLYVLFESLRGSFWVLTRVCSRLLTVCSRLLTVAHGLLTVCSRFGKGAQNPCAKFQADVFWEIFEPCHGANPGSATIPHMKDSFWAQRTQKVHLESSI